MSIKLTSFFFSFLRMKAHSYYKKYIQHIYPHKLPLIIYKVTHKFGYTMEFIDKTYNDTRSIKQDSSLTETKEPNTTLCSLSLYFDHFSHNNHYWFHLPASFLQNAFYPTKSTGINTKQINLLTNQYKW